MNNSRMKPVMNDPTKAGQIAARKHLFGGYSRYAVYPVHTRFDAVQWFVADADITDEITGYPAIIRQASTREEAMEELS